MNNKKRDPKAIIQRTLTNIAKLTQGENMEYQLMNFNVPKHLKQDLDAIASYRHISKTSILNILLEQNCRLELNRIDRRKLDESIASDVPTPFKQGPNQVPTRANALMFDNDCRQEEGLKR